MISKDADLIAEAYLSALQKIKNVPTDPATEDIAEVNPEVTDRENVEVSSPSVVSISAPVPVAQTGMTSDHSNAQAHEESEEHWMVRSNLFSLYCAAKKIHNLAQKGIDLEPWAQQKIAVCTDNLEAVMKYVAYEAAEKGIDICEQG